MLPRRPALGRRSFLGLGVAAAWATAACGSPRPAPQPVLKPRVLEGTNDRPRELGILGDSIAFGGGAYGSSSPKYENSFVGQLRSSLRADHGDGGTGWVLLNHALWPVTTENRGWDPRLKVVGPVAKPPRGVFRHTCARIPASPAKTPSAYVELRAEGTTFSTLVLASASRRSRQLVSVDGGEPVHLRNARRPSSRPDIASRPGTHPGHVWTDVPTPGPGPHTLRVWAENGAVELVGVRASTGSGSLVLTSAAVSGESLETFCGPGADDESGGTTGLGFLDSFRFDLLLVELGANDYNGGHPLAASRDRLLQIFGRQRATGGDVALMFPPISSPRLYPGAGAPSYEAYAASFADVASAEGVPFLDLTHLWGKTFEESDAVVPPRYADHAIHPSDAGAADIARRCREFLGL